MLIAGRYELLDQLGTGSMGTVYSGRDTLLDRLVALKTIRTGVTVEPEIRERFYREARACARLKHPNIITVHDVGETESIAWIAMELLQGSDFRALIASKPPLPTDVRIACMIQVCEALAHAHAHGVIHRDIKPSNLYLLDDQTVKVLDFGIARLPSSQLTVAGRILGTPNYMAPEQILGRPSDARSDLFSAAVVFFELLTWQHPFRDSIVQRRIVHGDPDSIFDYNSELPGILDRIFMRTLAKDPDSRYQTGTELAADLRTVLDAMRSNASPTFSRVELPSDRVLPVKSATPAASVTPSRFLVAPDGEDAEEWRLSEALRIVPEFEAAAEREDMEAAGAALAELEELASADRRFTEAYRLCRERFGAIKSARRESPITAPSRTEATVSPITAPQDCPVCGAMNRRVAVTCIQCGSKLATAAEAPAASLQNRQIDLDKTIIGSSAIPEHAFTPDRSATTPAAAAPQPAPVPADTAEPQPALPGPRRRLPSGVADLLSNRKILYAAGAGAVVTALAVVLTAGLFRSVPVEPAAGTAEVTVPATNIYAGPSNTETLIAQVPRGERLNLLGIPLSRDQQWVRVQPVQGRVKRAGFARASDLNRWSGNTPEAELALLRNLAAPNENSGALQERLRRLVALADAAGKRPVASQARLDAARIELTLAQTAKDAGSADWSAAAQRAGQLLALVRAAGQSNAEVGQAEALLQQLTLPPAAVPQPPDSSQAEPPRVSRSSIDKWVSEANTFWEQSRYAEAIRLLDRVLRADPQNQQARQLRRKIQIAQQIEADTTR